MIEVKTFEEWKGEVDEVLLDVCQMESDCLVDVNYREMFSQKKSPKFAAKVALRASDAPKELVAVIK